MKDISMLMKLLMIIYLIKGRRTNLIKQCAEQHADARGLETAARHALHASNTHVALHPPSDIDNELSSRIAREEENKVNFNSQ